MPTFRSAVGVLNPFGPIFTKELRVTSRRKRTYWLRVIYLGLLLLVLLATYAATRESVGGRAARTQQQAMMGSVFFLCFSMFCIIAMGLVAPVLTATAINAERLHKTLHVLLMTPIGNAQIVSGKLFSRLLVALTLIGLSLPVLALVRLLGGVEIWQMVGVICVCASFALACAAIGLFYSAVLSRAYAVILLSYGTLLFLYLFVPMCLALSSHQGRGSIPLWIAVNPFMCTAMMASPEPMMVRSVPWWPCVAVQLGMTLLLVVWTGAMLRRIARREEGAAAGPAPLARTAPPPLPAHPGTSAQRPQSGGILPIASPVSRADPRQVSDNPILWRETRRPLLPKGWQKITAVVVILGLLVCSYAALSSNNSLSNSEAQIVYANVFCGLAWLLVAVLAATAIAQEKESDTWTLLLATPVSGWSVVWGKVFGLLRQLIWPGVLLLAHFLVFALCGVIRWQSVLLVLWVILSFNAIWIATGLYLSLRLKKVTTAVIINLLLAVCAYVVVYVIAITIEGLWNGRHERISQNVSWSMPYMYLSIGMDAIDRRMGFRHEYSYGTYEPFSCPGGVHLSGLEFTSVVLLAGLLYLGLAFAILAYTANHFDRIVGRARQTGRNSYPPPRMSAASAPCG